MFPIILLLMKIFGKQFQVLHKFADTADKFIKLFSLQLFLYMCNFLCVYLFTGSILCA